MGVGQTERARSHWQREVLWGGRRNRSRGCLSLVCPFTSVLSFVFQFVLYFLFHCLSISTSISFSISFSPLCSTSPFKPLGRAPGDTH